jgi:hypothetical protein
MNRMLTMVVAAAALVLGALPLQAQTVTPSLPTSYDVSVLPATGDPLTVAAIAVRNTPVNGTSPICNQVALPACPLPCVNPTVGEVDDPYNAGRFCRLAIPIGLPVGSGYRAVAEAFVTSCIVNGVTTTPCGSGRSAVGVPPFDIASILGRPAVPTNVAVKR